jgi:hypothetical protein
MLGNYGQEEVTWHDAQDYFVSLVVHLAKLLNVEPIADDATFHYLTVFHDQDQYDMTELLEASIEQLEVDKQGD